MSKHFVALQGRIKGGGVGEAKRISQKSPPLVKNSLIAFWTTFWVEKSRRPKKKGFLPGAVKTLFKNITMHVFTARLTLC